MTTASSASDRYEEARAARQAWLDGSLPLDESASRMSAALRSLIEPPATEEHPRVAAERLLPGYVGDSDTSDGFDHEDMRSFGEIAYLAGIQAAWESWEPENAPGAGREWEYAARNDAYLPQTVIYETYAPDTSLHEARGLARRGGHTLIGRIVDSEWVVVK